MAASRVGDRQGADATRCLLERSRELYRQKEGELDGLLVDRLEEKSTLKEVMRSAKSACRVQSQWAPVLNRATTERLRELVTSTP